MKVHLLLVFAIVFVSKNPIVIIFTFCFHSNKEQLYMGKEKVRGDLEHAKENKSSAYTNVFIILA